MRRLRNEDEKLSKTLASLDRRVLEARKNLAAGRISVALRRTRAGLERCRRSFPQRAELMGILVEVEARAEIDGSVGRFRPVVAHQKAPWMAVRRRRVRLVPIALLLGLANYQNRLLRRLQDLTGDATEKEPLEPGEAV